MKIAILTQPLGKNFGGIIQAWALQQVLKSMGHEPVTIDRQADARGTIYYFARLGYRSLQKILGKRKAPIRFERYLPDILQNPLAFIDENLRLTEPLDSTAKLQKHFDREQYEAVIVGSDQVWRPIYSPNIGNFFLDFLEGKEITRIAYASSFGVSEWEFSLDQTKRYAQLSEKFCAIGVREDTAIELCLKYLRVQAEHVLDPTLLIKKEEYIKMIGSERIKCQSEKVFTYFLDKTPQKQAMADKVANKLTETVYSCQPRCGIEKIHAHDLEDYRMPDPRDWLAGIANAKFVLTDSFHGVVFSILFNKPFIAIANHERGTSRFSSLLKIFGLTERLVFIERESVSDLIDADINWEDVESKIVLLRKRSLDFLASAICSNNLRS